MTKKQQAEIMDQIAAIYEEWVAHTLNTDYGSRLINGLFNIAKEIDETRMSNAFRRGADTFANERV